MFFSQDTDADSLVGFGGCGSRQIGATALSPTKTKKRRLGLFTAVTNRCGGGGGVDESCAGFNEEENEAPSHFNTMFSQDSNMCSQMSQDFSDRFLRFNVKSSQQDDFSNMGDDARSMMSTDGFLHGKSHVSAQPLTTMKVRPNHTVFAAGIASTTEDTQKLILIAPPMENPFSTTSHIHSRKLPASTNLWIAPYRERPRYISDFEHIKGIGVGTFSSIFLARRRLDGIVYAVKRISKKINSEKEGILVVKEACAHAALAGCPHMVQYFGCWLDDGHLHIQTEYCDVGSLELFVSSRRAGGARFVPSSSVTGDSQLTADSLMADSQMSSIQGVEICSGDSNSGFPLQEEDDLPTATQPPQRQMRPPTEGERDDADPPDGAPLPFSDPLAWLVLQCVGEALAYMHARHIAHLDLRPANIFLTNRSTPPGADDAPPRSALPAALLSGRVAVKLGDLGHAVRADRAGDDDWTEGESRYCARELINGGLTADRARVDLLAADMFSLGATVYELCLGRDLGAGSDHGDEWHAIREGRLDPVFAATYSGELVGVVSELLRADPSRRPTASLLVATATAARHSRGTPGAHTSSSGDVSHAANSGDSGDREEIDRLTRENQDLRRRLGL